MFCPLHITTHPNTTHIHKQDLLRFNRFFMDKEEESVIKLQALSDRITAARGQQLETQELKAALVDFHGASETEERETEGAEHRHQHKHTQCSSSRTQQQTPSSSSRHQHTHTHTV